MSFFSLFTHPSYRPPVLATLVFLAFPNLLPYTIFTGVAAPSTYERRTETISSIKIKGLDKLEKQLKQMEKGAKELSRTKNVSFDELFTTSFIQKYTSFSSMDELLKAGGFNIESQEDFKAIPNDEFDKHIATTTKFKNWENMLDEATSQYIQQKLGL